MSLEPGHRAWRRQGRRRGVGMAAGRRQAGQRRGLSRVGGISAGRGRRALCTAEDSPLWPAQEDPSESTCGLLGRVTWVEPAVQTLPMHTPSFFAWKRLFKIQMFRGSPGRPAPHLGPLARGGQGRAVARGRCLDRFRTLWLLSELPGQSGGLGLSGGLGRAGCGAEKSRKLWVKERKGVSGRGSCQRFTGCCWAAAWSQPQAVALALQPTLWLAQLSSA